MNYTADDNVSNSWHYEVLEQCDEVASQLAIVMSQLTVKSHSPPIASRGLAIFSGLSELAGQTSDSETSGMKTT